MLGYSLLWFISAALSWICCLQLERQFCHLTVPWRPALSRRAYPFLCHLLGHLLCGAALTLISFLAHSFESAIIGYLLAWLLLLLGYCDARWFWLPDPLTLCLLWLGLLYSDLLIPDRPLSTRVIGGALGYGSTLLLNTLYRRIRGAEGLGGGDMKLIAALGCWLGWQSLAPLLSLACVLALLWIALFRYLARQQPLWSPFPFGVTLTFSGWLLVILQISSCPFVSEEFHIG